MAFWCPTFFNEDEESLTNNEIKNENKICMDNNEKTDETFENEN